MDEEIKILNNIFYNNNLYLSELNKFNIAVNKSRNYISQNKIRYYYKNQEIHIQFLYFVGGTVV